MNRKFYVKNIEVLVSEIGLLIAILLCAMSLFEILDTSVGTVSMMLIPIFAIISLIFEVQKSKIKRKMKNNGEYKSNKGNIKGKITAIIVIAISCILISGALCLVGIYGRIEAEQLYFTFVQPVTGTSTNIIMQAVIFISVGCLILFPLIFHLYKIVSNDFNYCRINEKKIKKNRKFSFLIPLISFICASALFVDCFDVVNLIKYQMASGAFFEEHFINAKDVDIVSPEQKRNLIIIFAESMESSYTSAENGGIMKENLIPNLTKLAEENINFSNTEKLGGALPITGTQWTTAGITSQLFGVPLKIQGNTYGDNFKFLEGAYGIPDILKQEGYTELSIKGSEIEFGGLKGLIDTHMTGKYFDFNTAKEEGYISKDYKVFWGFEDIKLFEYSKKEIEKAYNESKPFFITIETVDTHFPGYVCSECKLTGEDKYTTSIKCSDKQISDFVEWASNQEWYDNTTIAIIGDHLTMKKDYIKAESYTRTTYNCIINSVNQNKEHIKNRKFAETDLCPTILSAMGYEIKGNKMGIGTDLFSGTKTLLEEIDIETINEGLRERSKCYEKEILCQ